MLEVPYRQLYALEKGALHLFQREAAGLKHDLVCAAELARQESTTGSSGGVRHGSPSQLWGPGQGAALAALDAAQDRVDRLRAKMGAVREREAALVAQLRARVGHAAGGGADVAEGSFPEAWERTRFDRAVCEYALHCGAFDVAKALTYGEGKEPASAGGGGRDGTSPRDGPSPNRGRRNSLDGARERKAPSGAAAAIRAGAPLGGLSDYENVRGAEEVCEALGRRDAGPALAWCEANRARLRRAGGRAGEYLEFSLRAQEMVELLKGRRGGEALAHARAHLAGFAEWDPELWQLTLGALAFHPDMVPAVFSHKEEVDFTEMDAGDQGPPALDERLEVYRKMFDGDGWATLAEAFREGYFAVQGMTSEPLLETYMTLGLCALKTHYPYEDKAGAPGDPLRHPPIRRLAEGLPYAKHVRSKLLCRVTGKLMDDDNPPMVLPNGQCYSRLALDQGLRKAGQKRPADLPPDHLRCPETGEDFPASSATRAFLT